MPFSWPSVPDIFYRLHRLRRLIACGVVVPLIAFALAGIFGFGWFGSVAGLGATALLLTLIVASHAVIFPNAHQETLVISILLALLGIVGPFFGFFGWLFFLIFGAVFLLVGQNRVLSMGQKTHQPTFVSKVKTSASLEDARRWFPLRPNLQRGAYRCGAANADGIFPVLYDLPVLDMFDGVEAPETEVGADFTVTDENATFFAQIEVDEELLQRTKILEDIDAKGQVQALVEHHFKPLKKGCSVTEIETANNYPIGQTFGLWLNDYAKDGLVHHRDLLEQAETRSLRAAHRWSLFMLLGKRMMNRTMVGAMGQANDGVIGVESDSVPEALSALLVRLGPDFSAQGYSTGPMPLVTLEEFFEGNGDDGSFQAASLEDARQALEEMRARDDVADIRMGVTQWEGPSTWPLAEYVYFVTSAATSEVKSWLKGSGIWVSELSEGPEHRKREELFVPEGHRVIWGWID